jgi:hypothetical protein
MVPFTFGSLLAYWKRGLLLAMRFTLVIGLILSVATRGCSLYRTIDLRSLLAAPGKVENDCLHYLMNWLVTMW